MIESPAGTHPVARANPDVDAYCFPHNETSTGVQTVVGAPDGRDARTSSS